MELFKEEFNSLPQEEKETYFNKAEEILEGLYICTRTWSAWGYGTMSENDFLKAEYDSDLIYDTALNIYSFLRPKIRKGKIDSILKTDLENKK